MARMRNAGLPRTEFETPILLALEQLGGRARVSEIYASVLTHLKSQFTDYDYEEIATGPKGTEPRWHNKTRHAARELRIKGHLLPSMQNGVWEIPDLGQ